MTLRAITSWVGDTARQKWDEEQGRDIQQL